MICLLDLELFTNFRLNSNDEFLSQEGGNDICLGLHRHFATLDETVFHGTKEPDMKEKRVMRRMALRWPILCPAGIAVIIFYCVFTFTSLALFPRPYSPVNNWLSDLGNSSFSPNGAVFFNIGCVLTGLALFAFYAGFHSWYTREYWRRCLLIATQAVGFCSALALVMIGVFSEDYPAQHSFWSQVFFVLNLAVLLLANTSLITHPDFIKPVGYYGYAVAAINLTLVLISTTPLIEWLTVSTALAYAGLLVYNTFKLT